MKYRRLALYGTLSLAAAAGGYYVFRRSSAKPVTQFDTRTVERGTIDARLMASGTISPLVTVQVGSQVSGRICNLYADFNSLVKKGQVIAKIDPQLFDAALEQSKANFLVAEANLFKANVQLAEAKRQLARTQALAAKKLVAPADEDTARANADAAQAQVSATQAAIAQARAGLNQARVNLAYTTIVSPIGGIVISRNVDVGQTVAASFQAPTLFTIAEDLSKMQIHTAVAEADIGRVQPRMRATFTVDAFPRETFVGLVSQIRNSPQNVQNVVTYDVIIDVNNPGVRLKPGMTANVTLVYAESKNGLKVPNAALRYNPPAALLDQLKLAGHLPQMPGTKGRAHPGKSSSAAPRGTPTGPPGAEWRRVWTLRHGKPSPVMIQVGISDGTQTEVVGGSLNEGDEVIVEQQASSGRAPGFGPPRGHGVMHRL